MDQELFKKLSDLRSSHASVRYRALVMLRTTIIKSKGAVRMLLQEGYVELLLKILNDGKDQSRSAKTNDIILSILANLCLEVDACEKVLSCNGIETIAEVVAATEQESIHNRGVRTVANLAQNLPECHGEIFQQKLPAFVAKRLMETQDKECMSTFIRCIRIMGGTIDNVRRLVKESMAVSAVASVLKKDDKKLTGKALHAIHQMSSLRCCARFAEEILAAKAVEELVIGVEDEDKVKSSISFSIVLRLAEHENLRPSLGNAGAIDIFMREIGKEDSSVSSISVLNALCLCSREAVNRPKLHSAEALELFVSCLDMSNKEERGKKDFSMLYDRLISSLVYFLYDDAWMTRMLELDLIDILISHLQRITEVEFPKRDLDIEVSILASLAQDGIETKETEFSSERINVSPENDENCLDECETSVSVGEKKTSVPEIVDSTVTLLDDGISIDNREVKGLAATELPEMNKTSDEESLIDEDLADEEVKDLTSDSQRSQGQSSKHVFSINSPTYQLGHSSWSIEDYSSGVTCKSFGEERVAAQQTHSCLPSFAESQVVGQDLPPYSPLSGGASYYSPSHSIESSPKYSPNPYGSSLFARGQGSTQGSPAWSLASSSSRLSPFDNSYSPTNHSFSPAASTASSSLSPLHNQDLSNLYPRAPLSPLSIPFASASLSQPPFNEDRGSESPLFNSQMSLVSQTEMQDQNPTPPILAAERSQPFMKEVSMGPTEGRYTFSLVPLSQEEELIYSASEEDGEDEEAGGDQELKRENQEAGKCDIDSQADLNNPGTETVNQSQAGGSFDEMVTNNDSVKMMECQSSSGMTPESKETTDNKDSEGIIENRNFVMIAQSTDPVDIRGNKGGASRDPEETSENDHLLSRMPENIASTTSEKQKNITGDKVTEDDDSGGILDGECPSSPVPSSFSRVDDPIASTFLSSSVDDITNTGTGKTRFSHGAPQHGEISKKRKSDETDSPSVGALSKRSKEMSHCPDDADLFQSSQPERLGVKITIRKTKEHHLISHPSSKLSLKQPTSSGRNSGGQSPRYPFSSLDSLSPSPYASPASRHGLSPLASPRPYRSPFHNSGANHILPDSQRTLNTVQLGKLPRNVTGVRNESENGRRESLEGQSHQHNQRTTIIGEAAAASASTIDSSANNQNSDRLKNILRSSESNIMILLSRVSINSNPSQHLAQPKVFRSLLSYLSQAQNPLQRCYRLLHRVCTNSLCFQPLLLMQGPALIVRHLLLDPDGSFPHADESGKAQQWLCLDDIIHSSQNSDTASSSQASEFGRRMDFEFGNDAYGQLLSKNQSSSSSSLGSIFRQHPSLSLDSQSAQDGGHSSSSSSSHHGGLVYDSHCNRKAVRVQLGMRLLRDVSSIALTRFGDGEIQHILARGSSQDKLQCVLSLLHLLISCGTFSRHQLLTRASFQQVIHFLFVDDAPLARAAIVTAISLYAVTTGVSKTVERHFEFTPCPDICDDDSMDHLYNKRQKQQKQKGLDNENPSTQNQLSGKGKKEERLAFSKNSVSGSGSKLESSNDNKERPEYQGTLYDESPGPSTSAENHSSCVYATMVSDFDMRLAIVNESGNDKEVFKAHKSTLVRRSHYFSCMLEGSYDEANQDEVILKCVNVSGFEYILHYLHGCAFGCPVIDSVPLEIHNKDSPAGQAREKAENSKFDHNNILKHSCDTGTDKPLADKEYLSVHGKYLDQDSISGGTFHPLCSSGLIQSLDKPSSSSCCKSDTQKSVIHPDPTAVLNESSTLRTNTDAADGHSSNTRNQSKCCDDLAPSSSVSVDDSPIRGTASTSNQSPPSNLKNSDPGCDTDTIKVDNGKQGDPTLTTGTTSYAEENLSWEEAKKRRVDIILKKCEDVLVVADQFVLTELVAYVRSVMSHVCLLPHTCEIIFSLAVFYKMDNLVFDCIVGMILSRIPRSEVAEFVLKMGHSGYRDHVELVLQRITQLPS